MISYEIKIMHTFRKHYMAMHGANAIVYSIILSGALLTLFIGCALLYFRGGTLFNFMSPTIIILVLLYKSLYLQDNVKKYSKLLNDVNGILNKKTTESYTVKHNKFLDGTYKDEEPYLEALSNLLTHNGIENKIDGDGKLHIANFKL